MGGLVPVLLDADVRDGRVAMAPRSSVGVLAGVVPAIRASRLKVTDALRRVD